MKVAMQKVLLIAIAVLSWSAVAFEVDKTVTIKDTTSTIMGVNSIALSVKDLDKVLAFYQEATGFEVISRETVSGNKTADALYGVEGVSYEKAVLKAPNMLFELTAFKHNENAADRRMAAIGPGITHTCFQSPESRSGYRKFMAAGAEKLSRGDKPVDMGGYGVTYAYAYDPEGNMIELEQLDGKILERAAYDKAWQERDDALWMSQVAFATHDLDRLIAFYQDVLGILPYRKGEYSDMVQMDNIINIDNLHLKSGWFKMNGRSKVMEFWQFMSPETPAFSGERDVRALGYSFSLEVGDIQKEYARLSALGVKFVGEPVKLGAFWQVYARDVDGNIFSLRQALDPDSVLSVKVLDQTDPA